MSAVFDDLLRPRAGFALGFVGGGVTVLVLTLIPDDAAVELAAAVLAVIYSVYVGVALARGPLTALRLESVMFAVGLVLIGLGLWVDPVWLALGYVLHAGWDLAHGHGRPGVAGVPRWYVSACVPYDVAVAAGVMSAL